MAASLRLWRAKPSRSLRCPVASGFSSGAAAGSGRQPQLEKLTSTRQLDGVRHVILNNPKKRNALSLSMLKCLRNDILHDIESQALRVIIISAEGPVFSAGHDLKELSGEQDTKHHIEVFETCAEVMTLLQKLPVPVIAKVALEMLFTGEPISAHDALLHGLLSKVVPEDKLEEETMKIARKICETSRSVVALGKATFYKQMALDLDAAYRMTSQVMVDNLTLKDGQEGIEAFIQKRKPTWSHSMTTACK
ncbi:enoyl-CoA hydratase domain-containing protein 3, mitochondrial isoform 2-T2 [Pangshura tecta]